MPRKAEDWKPEKEKHTHYWIMEDLIEERCKCGGVRISAAEEQRRIEEWGNFLELVLTTESYEEFKEMKVAFATGDIDQIRRILRGVATRMVDTGRVDEWSEKIYDFPKALEKPHFPNPKTWNKYVIY